MAGQTFNDSRIDRSVGLLLLIMLILGFFVFAILGMQSVQENAVDMAEIPAPNVTEAPVYDFISESASGAVSSRHGGRPHFLLQP